MYQIVLNSLVLFVIAKKNKFVSPDEIKFLITRMQNYVSELFESVQHLISHLCTNIGSSYVFLRAVFRILDFFYILHKPGFSRVFFGPYLVKNFNRFTVSTPRYVVLVYNVTIGIVWVSYFALKLRL